MRIKCLYSILDRCHNTNCPALDGVKLPKRLRGRTTVFSHKNCPMTQTR